MGEQPILNVWQAEVCYGHRQVLKNISLSVERGKILGIVGESGSGKSTLLRACMGLLGSGGLVTRGNILYKGISIPDASKEELRQLCGPGMGMVFQNSQNALCPVKRIRSQVYESLRQHEKKIKKEEASMRAAEILESIGITETERVLDSYPFQLSGGMNQRVGIMMAMLQKPDLLFADEPTSALDVTVQAQVTDELLRLRSLYGTAIVLVTHNIGVVAKMADDIAVFRHGEMVEYGSRNEVLRTPKMSYTKELLAAAPVLKGESSHGVFTGGKTASEEFSTE